MSSKPNEAPEYIGVGPIVRGSAVIVEEGRLLLERMDYRGTEYVVLPGGQHEAGESVADCARREVHEETGFEVEIDRLLYVSERVPAATPGFHLLNICFLARRTGGEKRRTPVVESPVKAITEIFFAPLADVPRLLPALGERIARDAPDGFAFGSPRLVTVCGGLE